MSWVKEGVTVTVDWHVFVGDRWRVEPVPVGRTAPVNVYVTEDRMAPVKYRHQAGECRGECRLSCGHAVTYGCDCDTIAVEAADQAPEPPRVEIIRGQGKGLVVDVISVWAYGIEVMSPGGREWTLNTGDYREVTGQG